MKNNLIIILFFYFLFNYAITSANSLNQYIDNLRANWCEYLSQFEECVTSSNPSSIEDFICLDKNHNDKDQILWQIILDLRLKEIDRDIYDYLNDLDKAKFDYFWTSSSLTQEDASRDIENSFRNFQNRYTRECAPNGLINRDFLSCTWWVNVFSLWTNFSSDCNKINDVKIFAKKRAAYTLMHMNSHLVQRDTRAVFEEEQRTLYSRLIDKFYLQLSFVQRMWAKWTVRTPNTW